MTLQIQHIHWEQLPEIMVLWLQVTYLWFGFSPEVAKLLIREQGLESSERLRALTNKNFDDIYNVTRKQGGKHARQMSDRGRQVSIIAQENPKLAPYSIICGDAPLMEKLWE